jgi:glutamate dehydrogenase/leucine dehydrogenase
MGGPIVAALHQPPALLGWHAARLLAERDATIIAVSDSRGATWNPRGLDIAALHAHKMSSG